MGQHSGNWNPWVHYYSVPRLRVFSCWCEGHRLGQGLLRSRRWRQGQEWEDLEGVAAENEVGYEKELTGDGEQASGVHEGVGNWETADRGGTPKAWKGKDVNRAGEQQKSGKDLEANKLRERARNPEVNRFAAAVEAVWREIAWVGTCWLRAKTQRGSVLKVHGGTKDDLGERGKEGKTRQRKERNLLVHSKRHSAAYNRSQRNCFSIRSWDQVQSPIRHWKQGTVLVRRVLAGHYG